MQHAEPDHYLVCGRDRLTKKGYTMRNSDVDAKEVIVGVDVGKSFHHLYATLSTGKVIANRPIKQHEQKLLETFTKLRSLGSVLVCVDQPKNVGALTIACAKKAGCEVGYLPGYTMRQAANLLPGVAKSDGRDAYVTCTITKSLPECLRSLPEASELRASLCALASCDEDYCHDTTREINRLRAHLIESCPAFEAALGDSITSPFVLKLLEHYGGPWGMRDAGKDEVLKWVGSQKRVTKKVFERLFEAAFCAEERPLGVSYREQGVSVCARRIAELIELRKAIEKDMCKLLEGDVTFAILKSMPGVGTKTAVAFMTTVDMAAFSSADKLASYAGIAPKTRQSGTSIKGECASRAGNKALKSALYLSAFTSLRCDASSRNYYDKKRAEGKRHAAALICLARRRLKIMYAMVRDNRPYRATL